MDVQLDNICKAYGENVILQNFSLTLKQGSVYVLTGNSGAGKTTLLHIILGLVQPDSGEITADVRYTAVFQENRLLPRRSAVENLAFVAEKSTKKAALEALLKEILPQDSLEKPIEELSGGMQRRVAIARALLVPSDCVLMDEPFTGLDDDTTQNVIAFIFRHLNGRTLLLSTHQPEALNGWQTEHISL